MFVVEPLVVLLAPGRIARGLGPPVSLIARTSPASRLGLGSGKAQKNVKLFMHVC